MKNLFTIILLLSLSISGFAQTEKKSWMIGGSASGSTRLNNNSSHAYYFVVAPQAGYFLFNNFALGLSPNFGFNHTGNFRSTSFGIGPFLRYYMGKNKLRFFIEAMPVYSFQSYTQKLITSDPIKNTYHIWIGNISAGLVYFINKNIGLEAKVQYSYSDSKYNSPSSGLNLKVGFQIYLPAKEKEVLN